MATGVGLPLNSCRRKRLPFCLAPCAAVTLSADSLGLRPQNCQIFVEGDTGERLASLMPRLHPSRVWRWPCFLSFVCIIGASSQNELISFSGPLVCVPMSSYSSKTFILRGRHGRKVVVLTPQAPIGVVLCNRAKVPSHLLRFLGVLGGRTGKAARQAIACTLYDLPILLCSVLHATVRTELRSYTACCHLVDGSLAQPTTAFVSGAKGPDMNSTGADHSCVVCPSLSCRSAMAYYKHTYRSRQAELAVSNACLRNVGR